jgi:DNA polymerase III subunit delta
MNKLTLQPLKTAYLIHGEEELLRIEAVDAIRSAARSQNFGEREVMVVEAGFEWSSIISATQSVGLFADKKLLEIHISSGKPGKEGSIVLQQLAENLPDDICIILLLPKMERLQTQTKWFQSWSKNATVIEAKAISQAALPLWVKKRLKNQNLNISDDALALFVEKVEGNLLAAQQEIDKLALIHPRGHLVTLTDAQNAVANVARFDVLQLASTWMKGDTKRLLLLLDGLAAGENEPVLLLWALSEDIRTLLRLLAAFKQGKSVNELKQSLRLWGEKQNLAPLAAKRIGAKRLLAALQVCARIDRQIKGAEKGKAWTEIKHLLLSLAC